MRHTTVRDDDVQIPRARYGDIHSLLIPYKPSIVETVTPNSREDCYISLGSLHRVDCSNRKSDVVL